MQFASLWITLVYFLLLPARAPVVVVVQQQRVVDQTAVVQEIIFRTRCKAPDPINYCTIGSGSGLLHGTADVSGVQHIQADSWIIQYVAPNELQHKHQPDHVNIRVIPAVNYMFIGKSTITGHSGADDRQYEGALYIIMCRPVTTVL